MNQVVTNLGAIEGLQKEGYFLFLGIPYAKPPVGALRWRPPQEMDPWDGVYSATQFPNRSMQEMGARPGFYAKEFDHEEELMTPVSEDSLYLNIWTPAKAAGEKLPVAFWIHGGAFMGGFGHEKEFDGEAYCKRGVILVTINYRLNIYGFLAHPWLSEESRAEGLPAVSGNYGILDQIAALKWVYDNIEAFGGDSNNITVFGQSAGCMSVQTLISSPLSRGMISKAILQSAPGLGYKHTLEIAEQQGMEFSANAGVHTLDEMRSLTAEQIETAAAPLIMQGFRTNTLAYTPVVDGTVLADGYDELLERGEIHDIPYMAGCTMQDINVNLEELAKGNHGKVYDGCKNWGNALLKNDRNPAYLYYFTRQLPGDDAGAFHSSELWYMFGTYDRCWRPFAEADAKLSADMMDYWTNFMKSGNPNGEGLSEWNPYHNDEDIKILDI